jgi:hypothetical protein
MESKIKSLLVEKEEVYSLHFPQDDVLFLKDDQARRKKRLDDAISLGNIEHEKVKILFQDIEGFKRVETTIWGVTDKSIILKKGVVIPIHRIVKIDLI